MKTLVFAFDIAKLDVPEFHDFLTKIMNAQMGVSLGLCKFNIFEHGVQRVFEMLDPLHVEAYGESAAAGVRCICPMCEHHRSADKLKAEADGNSSH